MSSKADKIYPDSGVELNPFTARYYDEVMNIASLGLYRGFLHRAIKALDIRRGDKILDLGCGTGRNARVMASYLSDEGTITGMDISPVMQRQFNKKCSTYRNISFIRQRIDLPFSLPERFDKIFISFVLHGFPHKNRQRVLHNMDTHLKPGGTLFILDYAEFDMSEMPSWHRFIFKTIECKFAYDFIARDWKGILADYSFKAFEESFFFKNYVRLLKARK